jgi:hypothetical protein
VGRRSRARQRALLLTPETRWECPNCPATHLTTVANPHLPFHECPGLHGALAPYVEAGTRCKVEAVPWQDYAAGQTGLRTDGDGRPISAVVTTRDDGQDCAVFPGTATGSAEDLH